MQLLYNVVAVADSLFALVLWRQETNASSPCSEFRHFICRWICEQFVENWRKRRKTEPTQLSIYSCLLGRKRSLQYNALRPSSRGGLAVRYTYTQNLPDCRQCSYHSVKRVHHILIAQKEHKTVWAMNYEVGSLREFRVIYWWRIELKNFQFSSFAWGKYDKTWKTLSSTFADYKLALLGKGSAIKSLRSLFAYSCRQACAKTLESLKFLCFLRLPLFWR